jgi:hypothetical protein
VTSEMNRGAGSMPFVQGLVERLGNLDADEASLTWPSTQEVERILCILRESSSSDLRVLLLQILARVVCSSPEAVFEDRSDAAAPEIEKVTGIVRDGLEKVLDLHRSGSDSEKIAAAHLFLQIPQLGIDAFESLRRAAETSSSSEHLATVLLALAYSWKRSRGLGEATTPVPLLRAGLSDQSFLVRFCAACALTALGETMDGSEVLILVDGWVQPVHMPKEWNWFELRDWCTTAHIATRLLSRVNCLHPDRALERLLDAGDADSDTLIHLAFFAGHLVGSSVSLTRSRLGLLQKRTLEFVAREAAQHDLHWAVREQLARLGFVPAKAGEEILSFLSGESIEWQEIVSHTSALPEAVSLRRLFLMVGAGEIAPRLAAELLVTQLPPDSVLVLALSWRGLESYAMHDLDSQQRLQWFSCEVFEEPRIPSEKKRAALGLALERLLHEPSNEPCNYHRGRTYVTNFWFLSNHGPRHSSDEELLLAIHNASSEEPLRTLLHQLDPAARCRALEVAPPRQQCLFVDLCSSSEWTRTIGVYLIQGSYGFSRTERIRLLSRGSRQAFDIWANLALDDTSVLHAARKLRKLGDASR